MSACDKRQARLAFCYYSLEYYFYHFAEKLIFVVIVQVWIHWGEKIVSHAHPLQLNKKYSRQSLVDILYIDWEQEWKHLYNLNAIQ